MARFATTLAQTSEGDGSSVQKASGEKRLRRDVGAIELLNVAFVQRRVLPSVEGEKAKLETFHHSLMLRGVRLVQEL